MKEHIIDDQLYEALKQALFFIYQGKKVPNTEILSLLQALAKV